MHNTLDLKLKLVLFKLFCMFAYNEILYAGYYFIKIVCAAKPRKIFGVQNCSHEKMFAPNVRTLENGVRTYFLIAPNFVRTHGLRFRPPCPRVVVMGGPNSPPREVVMGGLASLPIFSRPNLNSFQGS